MKLSLHYTITLSLIAASGLKADTLCVNPEGSGEYPTIQAAIDAACPGDVIELADGVYRGEGNRDLSDAGKSCCVRSASGDPVKCVLDCEEEGRGFCFSNDEEIDFRIEGIAITHGQPSGDDVYNLYGGAILCFGASLSLMNCIIANNDAEYSVDDTSYYGWGGGLCIYNSDITMTGCLIYENHAFFGGGIHSENSTFHLRDCTFSSNGALAFGGGMNTYRVELDIVGVSFLENTCAFPEGVEGSGGGLNLVDSDLSAIGCVIANNYGRQDSGGMYCSLADPELVNCVFIGNASDGNGGGLNLVVSNPVLLNCAFVTNSALRGGGVYCNRDCMPIFKSCFILRNSAVETGSGVYVVGES